MNTERIHLICFSPTGTSHSVAASVAVGMCHPHWMETDLTWGNPGVVECPAGELVIVAVPVYGGRVAETAMERLQDVRGAGTPVVPVVVYGNRDYEDALRELTDWAVAHGFVPVAGAAFIGEHSFSRPGNPVAAGRPDKEDRRKAGDFGACVMKRLEDADWLCNPGALTVKGNFPYKEKSPKTPQAPLTDKALCSLCGHCAEVCPTGAVRIGEEPVTDAEACIKCCACVRDCPGKARIFDTPYTKMLSEHFSARREPELFF